MVTGKAEIVYDLSWVVSIVSAVHRLTGASQSEIMHSMPMMLCMSYYVQAAKENGVKGIGRRSSEEIILAKDRRACELVVERLEELQVVKAEEKEHFIQMMLDVNSTGE